MRPSRRIDSAEWTPPYDPFKPNLPYQGGLQLQVRRHIPPLSFGRAYQRPQRHQPTRFEDLLDRIPSEYCFQNPPPSTAPHPDPSIHTLKVVKEIATRDGRGPQVVCCQLDQQPGYVVAKIFDPLYYTWNLDDVVYWADRHYSCEAAAYEHVKRVGIDGKYLPRYHGCWTFEVHLANQPDKKRKVRMILMDYIPGSAMYSLLTTDQVDKFSPDTRLDILAQAMEKYCWLAFFGIVQNDFAPRNIMISTEQRVTLIDLSQSYVTGLPYSDPPFRIERKRPRSPIDIFRGVYSSEFDCWVPDRYRSKAVFRQWMEMRWGESEEFDSCPVYPNDPERSLGV